MDILKQKTRVKSKRTVFSKTCIDIVDFFLSHTDLYFTPLTVSLSMEKSQATIKDCMNLLKANGYLSKLSDSGSVYHITKENMEFWRTDFKAHVLSLMDCSLQDIKNMMPPEFPVPDYKLPDGGFKL